MYTRLTRNMYKYIYTCIYKYNVLRLMTTFTRRAIYYYMNMCNNFNIACKLKRVQTTLSGAKMLSIQQKYELYYNINKIV